MYLDSFYFIVILRFMEKDDKAIIEDIDLNKNNEIVVEANYEMNGFSHNSSKN